MRLILLASLLVVVAASAMLADGSGAPAGQVAEIAQIECDAADHDNHLGQCVEHHLHAVKPYVTSLRLNRLPSGRAPLLASLRTAKNAPSDAFRPPILNS